MTAGGRLQRPEREAACAREVTVVILGCVLGRAVATVVAVATAAALFSVGVQATRAATDPLSADSLVASVGAYAGLGADHLTGTPAEARTQDWLSRQLHAAGATTGSDAYAFLGFRPTKVEFTLQTRAPRDLPGVVPYFYSGITPPEGVTARLIDGGHGTPADLTVNNVAGRIAVVEILQPSGPASTFASAFAAVEQAGAAGLVVVTDGPEDYAVQQDVDSRAGLHHLPTLIIGARTGQGLIADAKGGVTATLTLTAKVGSSCDTDVWGVLPGRDPDRYVIVGTPTSGFDPAASERGSGVAALIGLARRFGAVPQAQRPVGLVFAGLSGHEVGFLGLPVLMETHPDWFSMADAYVHLGASIAASATLTDALGTPHPLPVGDPSRALYVSENAVLAQGVAQSFGAAQPLAQVPPAVLDPGEQAVAYAAGVPIVAESGTSAYFHTAGDAVSGVSGSLLAGQAASFGAMVDFVGGTAAHQVRNTNVVAEALLAAQPAGGVPPTPVASCAHPTPLQPIAPPTSGNVTGISLALGLLPAYESEQPGLAWEGRWQERSVSWPSSATEAPLHGVVFAPNPPPAGRVPGVVIVPGSGPGVQTFYQWAARDLAAHGYVALTVDPQGVGQSGTFGTPICTIGMLGPMQLSPCPGVPFQQAGNFVDAAESGVDFLVSSADPYRAQLDPTRIGAAGHSLGARAVSYAQAVDTRIGAVVAWDNLASNLDGDAGSASGGPPLGTIIGGELPGPGIAITPRVPALGEASDSSPHAGADTKKTAFDQWVAAKVASMELVFAGAVHDDWSQTASTSSAGEVSLHRFEYYTRAWFDLWLRHDDSAVARLTAPTVLGANRADVLSSTFRSGLYLPGGASCGDLRAGCPG